MSDQFSKDRERFISIIKEMDDETSLTAIHNTHSHNDNGESSDYIHQALSEPLPTANSSSSHQGSSVYPSTQYGGATIQRRLGSVASPGLSFHPFTGVPPTMAALPRPNLHSIPPSVPSHTIPNLPYSNFPYSIPYAYPNFIYSPMFPTSFPSNPMISLPPPESSLPLTNWTIDDVHHWAETHLKSVGLPTQHADLLKEQAINGIALSKMTYRELRDSGLPVGPASYLSNVLLKINKSNNQQQHHQVSVKMQIFWNEFITSNTSSIISKDLLDFPVFEFKYISLIDNYLFAIPFYSKVLLLRPCYYDLWNLISAAFKKGEVNVAIVGSAGVGKTLFFLFILLQLQPWGNSKVPIIYQHHDHGLWLLLNNKWELIVRPDEIFQYFFLPETIYVVDDTTPIRTIGMECKTILLTSLQSKTLKTFKKAQHVIYYMPPWEWKELEIVATKKDLNTAEMFERFMVFGGNPKLVFGNEQWDDLLMNQFLEYSTLRRIVASITYDEKIGHSSQNLLHLQPTEDYQHYRIRFASVLVEKKFLEKWIALEREKFGQFGRTLYEDPLMVPLRGHFWESLVHHYLSKGGTYQVRLLRKDGKGQDGILPIPPCKKVDATSLSDISKYTKDEKTWIRPIISHFDAVDAIIPGIGFFHINTAKRTGIKQNGLSRVLQELDNNPVNNNIFYVVPPDVYANFKLPLPFLDTQNKKAISLASNIKMFQQYVLLFDVYDSKYQ